MGPHEFPAPHPIGRGADQRDDIPFISALSELRVVLVEPRSFRALQMAFLAISMVGLGVGVLLSGKAFILFGPAGWYLPFGLTLAGVLLRAIDRN
jgi:hypothetical protein